MLLIGDGPLGEKMRDFSGSVLYSRLRDDVGTSRAPQHRPQTLGPKPKPQKPTKLSIM